MSSCVLSFLQAVGSSARSGGAAGLLSCGTGSNFTTRRSARNPDCRDNPRRPEASDPRRPPALRAKGAETSHLGLRCLELAMDFHEHQQSVHSLIVRGLFELFGLQMTMSVEPIDSAACAKVLSPGLQPLQGFVQGGLRRQPVEADAEDVHGPGDGCAR